MISVLGDLKFTLNMFPGILRLRQLVAGYGSLVDLGCGADSPMRFLDFKGESIGVDAYEPSIQSSRDLGIHSRYILGGVLPIPLEDKSVDVAVALDLIEHFPKQDGFRLIDEMWRVARRRIIILTPNGFLPQEPKDGNPFQRHLSGWSAEEMRQLGFETRGIYGLKGLRGEWQTVTRKPTALWWLLSKCSDAFVYQAAHRAAAILCWKDAA